MAPTLCAFSVLANCPTTFPRATRSFLLFEGPTQVRHPLAPSGLFPVGAMLTLASLFGATVFAEDLGLHPEQPRQGTIAATVLSSGPLPQDACRGQWLWLSHLSKGEAAGVIILGGGTRYRSLSCCPWLSVSSEG